MNFLTSTKFRTTSNNLNTLNNHSFSMKEFKAFLEKKAFEEEVNEVTHMMI